MPGELQHKTKVKVSAITASKDSCFERLEVS